MTMAIAQLRFDWEPQAPLLVGYGYEFTREAGLIRRGEKKVVQYQSRNPQHQHEPSLLATSVKGVFRSAAAWLVERTGQMAQSPGTRSRRFITCDYGNALPEKGGWRKEVVRLVREDQLCPVCRVFGGTGCLSGASRNVLRQQGAVRFRFDEQRDALFGTVRPAGSQVFAWEVASADKTPNPLLSEQLRTPHGQHLCVEIQADDPASYQLGISLIALSADLISSGFFRFGRFTSRGYGWVQLRRPAGRQIGLGNLIEDVMPSWQTADSAVSLAGQLLGDAATGVLERTVAEWIGD